MTMDQEFIEYVVKSIVSKPDDVHIDRSIDERGVLLELTVNPDDLGRVIGKRGNTAQSMRTLLRALGTKDSARYNLKIIDNGDPDYNKKNNKNDDDKKTTDEDDQSDNSSDSNDDQDDGAQPQSDGASQWSHMSSDDETDDDATTDEDEQTEEDSSTSSTSESVEQTKKELADLDDLDL